MLAAITMNPIPTETLMPAIAAPYVLVLGGALTLAALVVLVVRAAIDRPDATPASTPTEEQPPQREAA